MEKPVLSPDFAIDDIHNYINDHIGIEISSNRSEEDDTSIEFVDDERKIASILAGENVIKLHYPYRHLHVIRNANSSLLSRDF